ncbi:hypothetical protein [Methanosphaera cuniculi]|uniref:hypothetical protein n=1 Tax=Methanosphaera cuniculi TaxID=1077256 RepID=UPI0026F2E0F6|nr:hypothetical protein [Methanosphaera cuniculi]
MISSRGFGFLGLAFLAFLFVVFSSSFFVVLVLFLDFGGLPGPRFGLPSVVLFFLGLPGLRFGFSSSSSFFLFLDFGGLPGPRFLGGSCFSMIVV